jgi:hypothetical protein
MKILSLMIVMLLLDSSLLFSQVAINTDGSASDNSAMLDVKSTTKGMLIPRMTLSDRDDIDNPATGLLIFCTGDNHYYSNKGTPTLPNWVMVSNQWLFTGSDIYFTGGRVGLSKTNPDFTLDVLGDINFSGTLRKNGTTVGTGVAAVSAIAPLTSSEGATPDISIPQANSGSNGFLSSTDWNTFNNKQNTLTFGNLTSGDIALTGGAGAVIGSGTNMTVNKGNITEVISSVLTITGGTGSVLGTGASIQVKSANSSQSGYLSNTEWNSFNNKVSSQWVTNGQDISYNTGKVGIGTATPAPSAALEITSTNSGVLFPRMTLDQRNAITGPAEGLIVFCTDCGARGTLSFYSNGAWWTYTPCAAPSPSVGSHIVTPGQITWNWTAVAGATGYRWNTTDSFGPAVDIGTSTSKTETGIACDAIYTRYVWAYNACGVSVSTALAQSIPSVAPATPTAGTHTSIQISIDWNWNTVSGATGYKWNTSSDYGTATDMGTSTTKSETNLTCNTSYNRYVWAYNGCGYSSPVTLSYSTLTCCGLYSITVNHVAGNVAPVAKTVTYGTVTGIPGEPSKCWITSNLGADHQATSKDDATEPSAGWYWQFNKKQGYRYTTTRTPASAWIYPVNENLDWQAVNDPCALELGTGWRVPTSAEWINADAGGNWTTWTGPWESLLKLHAAGYLRPDNGTMDAGVRGVYGEYWSNTQISNTNANSLTIYVAYTVVINRQKAQGHSLRCIRNY